MSPAAKRLVAFALMSVSIIATAGWAWASYRAKEMVGSPFAWAPFIVAYFWGITLLPPLEAEADENTKKRRRKKLIIVFLGISAVVGLLFVLGHILLGDPTKSAQSYAPWSVMAALAAYAYYYPVWSRPSGMGGVVAPILFFFGIAAVPVMCVELYMASSEEVIAVPTARGISNAASNFVSFRNPEVEPSKALLYTFHSTRNKNHKASFTALIPVRTDRNDSLFDTWIVLDKDDYYYSSLGDSAIAIKERAFYADCRKRVFNFPYDSVVFYDRGKLNHRHILSKKNYPIQEEAIVLQPVFVPLKEYASSELTTWLGLFGVVTVIFWATTAWYNPKTD